jgi:hypothetical protein
MAAMIMSRTCREHHKDMKILVLLGEHVLKMWKDIGCKDSNPLMRCC